VCRDIARRIELIEAMAKDMLLDLKKGGRTRADQ
jgi:hypothetical protein